MKSATRCKLPPTAAQLGIHATAVNLQAAQPATQAAWDNDDLLTGGQGTVNQSARHHRAETADSEDAVDGQARPVEVSLGRQIGQRSLDGIDQLRETPARVG